MPLHTTKVRRQTTAGPYSREEASAKPAMAEFPEESMQIHRLGRDISVLSDHIPAPGIGFVPVNAFVLHAAEPVVVDTGMPDRDFMNVLGSVVDPQDVRWFGSHTQTAITRVLCSTSSRQHRGRG